MTYLLYLDSDDKRQDKFEEPRKPVKRLRQRPSTASTSTTLKVSQPEFVAATTYRPANKYIQVRTNVATTISESPSSTTTTTTTSQRLTTPTTTPEPELVTASDEDRDRIRLYNENLRKSKTTTVGVDKTTTYKPTLLSLKVSSKTSFSTASAGSGKKIEKVTLKEDSGEKNDKDSIGPKSSTDYDYTYYDTDPDSDYADFVSSKQDKYGKKSNKVIVAKS